MSKSPAPVPDAAHLTTCHLAWQITAHACHRGFCGSTLNHARYDAANRIASITYPSGAVVSYTRDTMGRVTAVSAQPPGGSSTPVVSSVAYEPFGPYTALTYGNGVAESRGFDQDYRLTGITDTGSSVLQNLGYAYYPTNNVHTITDAVNSGNTQSFSYDSMQHLTQATGGYGTFGFGYDKDGNRLSQSLGGVTTTYGYGTADDLLTSESVGGVQTQAIGYTADGRIATLNPGIQAPGGQYITSLSYNQDAQLAAVNAASGALASYTYDGFGQRLIKTISGTNGDIYQYGQNGMLLEETNSSGVAQADYIYLNGRPIATLDPSTGTVYYLHDDMLGTPQLATDSSQSVAWQASYQPFGTASVSGAVTQNLRFPGQYFDVESGWNHNGFRNYIPDLGRYAEPDPLGLQGSARFYDSETGRLLSHAPNDFGANESNPFVYTLDDPLDFEDPFGLQSAPAPLGFCPARIPTVQDINGKVIEEENSKFNECIKKGQNNAAFEGMANAVSDLARNARETSKDNNPETKVASELVSSELDLQGDCLEEHPLAVLSPHYQGAFKPGDLGRVPAWLELLK